MRRLPFLSLGLLVALMPLAGCESAPRVRPVKMGDVASGGDTVEAIRRQLKGTWDLVSLELVSASGSKAPVQASGRLTYDDYGNMAMRGTIAGGQTIDPSVLNLTGQVAIDPATHSFRFTQIKAGSTDERRVDPTIDATKVRYYEFQGDTLTTTLKDAKGSTTAVAAWKKID
jgi:hypothetical protein